MDYRPLDRGKDAEAVAELVAVGAAADGHPPLSEEKHQDLLNGGARGRGIVGEHLGRVAAYAHLLPTGAATWEVEMVVRPNLRSAVAYRRLAEAATSFLPGGVTARVWSFAPDQTEALRNMGLEECRELRQMRRPLPASAPQLPDGIAVLAFRPGVDDATWLAAHEAAFGNGWSEVELAARLKRGWFDAAGFLLAWDGSDLAAYCWTKVHPGRVGEIYVIGTAPDHRGRGLGEAMVLAGLADLAERRGCTTGMLYVDGDNEPAVRLYERLGLTTVRVDRVFASPPSSPQPNR